MFYKVHGIRVLMYHNNKLLIMKRAKTDKSDANLWDIPGGKIEPDETSSETLGREIFEETGLDKKSVSVKRLYGLIVEDFDKMSKLVIAVYLCESTSDNIRLNNEHSEYVWADINSIKSFKLGRILLSLAPSLPKFCN